MLLVFQPLGPVHGTDALGAQLSSESMVSRAALFSVACLPAPPLHVPAIGCVCQEINRLDQTKGMNVTSKESDETASIAVLIFSSLAPRYRLAVGSEQVEAFGTLGVPRAHAWQAGGEFKSCFSVCQM